MKQVDEGIFLHRTNYSESSLIITMLTRESGIRKFIFKGGKKKAHSLYPLSISELTYFGRADSELLQLTQAEPTVNLSFVFDPVRSTIAFFVAELIRKGILESSKDEATFNFLNRKITELDSTEALTIFPLKFLIEFTAFIGIQPLIDGDNLTLFDLEAGTIGKAGMNSEYCETGDHVSLIRGIIQDSNLKGNKEIREKAFETMLRYYAYHVPNLEEITSLEIVRQVLND